MVLTHKYTVEGLLLPAGAAARAPLFTLQSLVGALLASCIDRNLSRKVGSD